MTITRAEAAARLGIKERELAGVVHTEHGVVMMTTAGVEYIDVPEDQPDAAGQTGLMYHRLPNPDLTYNFPCWAGPVVDDEDAVGEGDQVDGDAEGDDAEAGLEVPAGSIDAVLDWVRGGPGGTEPTDGWPERAAAALDAEQAGKARARLIATLTEALATIDAEVDDEDAVGEGDQVDGDAEGDDAEGEG